jgi:hypothetical protein
LLNLCELGTERAYGYCRFFGRCTAKTADERLEALKSTIEEYRLDSDPSLIVQGNDQID